MTIGLELAPTAMRAFTKYEGLGNDFILLDGREWPEESVTPALAQRLCDRHRGIGGDGVLWVAPTGENSARMVIYNADGSRPEMCGNGVRCVVAWMADRAMVPSDGRVVIESDAGPKPSRVVERAGDLVRVAVEMGAAKVSSEHSTVTVAGEAIDVTAVDMGNPHGVLFSPRAERMEVVRAVTALREFPKGVNVEFVEPAGDGFRVRVHERGVGWTEACGTGACAVAAAAVARGMVRAGEEISITLDGGELRIRIDPESFRVLMTGPARRVFAGSLSVSPDGQ